MPKQNDFQNAAKAQKSLRQNKDLVLRGPILPMHTECCQQDYIYISSDLIIYSIIQIYDKYIYISNQIIYRIQQRAFMSDCCESFIATLPFSFKAHTNTTICYHCYHCIYNNYYYSNVRQPIKPTIERVSFTSTTTTSTSTKQSTPFIDRGFYPLGSHGTTMQKVCCKNIRAR